MTTLGQKLRKLRKERKLTQNELCHNLVTPSMISQIESDRATPSAALLAQLAERLAVDVSFFADDISSKTDLASYYRQARHYMNERRFGEAADLLQQIAFPVPPQFKTEAIYTDLAQCYVYLGRLDDACIMYERVVQVAYERQDVPTAIHAYFHLGQLQRKTNHLTIARMYWQRAADLLVRHPDLHMPIALKIYANLGRLYMQDRLWKEAKQCYMAALDSAEQLHNTNDECSILQGLSYVHTELSEFPAALDYNNRAITGYHQLGNIRGYNQCLVNKVVILRKLGKFDEALHHLEWCRTIEDFRADTMRFANALGEAAQVYLLMGDVDQAVDFAKRAIELDKSNRMLGAEMHLVCAHAAYMKKDFDGCLSELHAGRRVLPESISSDGAAYERLERSCHLEMGRVHEAISTAMTFAEGVLQGA